MAKKKSEDFMEFINKHSKEVAHIQAGVIAEMVCTCTLCEVTEVDMISTDPFYFAMNLKKKGWTATEDEILCAKCSHDLGK